MSIMQAVIWAALSGVGLALVLPCVQAIIAELYTAFERGRAFGFLFTVSALGLPSIICTPSLSCVTSHYYISTCVWRKMSAFSFACRWRPGSVLRNRIWKQGCSWN